MTDRQRFPYDVYVGAPAQNPMFSPDQHAITKFLSYTRPVKCAYCGKKKKRHWTQLRFFRVMEGNFALAPSKEIYPPLSPVCPDHILREDNEESKLAKPPKSKS